ncbi:MAG: cytochrome b N-terminal domain-containing protein [Deltaproteobacteria bacterium]|nr:cytochrome b N-terminal domain-containing protein [Deltaproteobacteria bacterium]
MTKQIWRVLGWSLVMLLVVEALTGAALAAFYAPSSTDAWASVAYVQDQMPWGWLVRGLHFHAASAIVIISGVHLLQIAVAGTYRERAAAWWIGLVLVLLVLGFAISGYVLRWDQAGYWANRVEVGIAAGTPVVGGLIRSLAIGGNEYGNLTLTRFYTLHVIALPALITAGVVVHIVLAKRARDWSDGLRAAFAMAAVFAVLVGYVVSQHGADLAAPADPSAAFDARPLWYFRWLFELRHLAGSAEKLAAMAAPAVVGGFLVALPLVDKPERQAKRMPWIAGVVGLFALIFVLTIASFVQDSGDADLAKRQAQAEKDASRTRALAVKHGVPATGPLDIKQGIVMYRARSLYEKRCTGCHAATSKDRKGPIIGAGHGNRAWLTAFLKEPSGDAFWGHTKLAKTDDAMKPVELGEGDLADLTELLYAQSGASDVDAARRDRGKVIFDKACTDCHAIEEGVAGASAPGLGGLGSRDWYTSFIGNPKSPVHMGSDHSQMPRFDKDLSIVDRDALADYLVWLRTATQRDVDLLEPL